MKRIIPFQTLDSELVSNGVDVRKVVNTLSSFTDPESNVNSTVGYIYSMYGHRLVVVYKMNNDGSIYGITKCNLHDDSDGYSCRDLFNDITNGLTQNLCLSKVFDVEYQNKILELEISKRVIKILKRG